MAIPNGKNGFSSEKKAREFLTGLDFDAENFVYFTLGKNVYAYTQSENEKLIVGKDYAELTTGNGRKLRKSTDLDSAGKKLKKHTLSAVSKKDKVGLKTFEEKEGLSFTYGKSAKKFPALSKVGENALFVFLSEELPEKHIVDKDTVKRVSLPKSKEKAGAKAETKDKEKEETTPKKAKGSKKSAPAKTNAKFDDAFVLVAEDNIERLTEKSVKKVAGLLNQLREAKKEDRAIEVTVSSIVRENAENYFVCLYRKSLPVRMKFEDTFVSYPLNLDNVDNTTQAGKEEILVREVTFGEKMYGANIKVKLLNIPSENPKELSENGDYGVLVSRKDYNLEYEKASYDEGINGKKLEVGAFARGIIYSVGDWGVGINVGGIDTTVRADMLTNRYIASPVEFKRLFRVNDTVVVKITDIDTKRVHRKISVEGRSYERLNSKSFNKGLTKGSKTFARITRKGHAKDDAEKVVYALCLEETGAPAISSPIVKGSVGFNLKKGELVRVQVLEFLSDGHIYVAICGVHGAGNIGRME